MSQAGAGPIALPGNNRPSRAVTVPQPTPLPPQSNPRVQTYQPNDLIGHPSNLLRVAGEEPMIPSSADPLPGPRSVPGDSPLALPYGGESDLLPGQPYSDQSSGWNFFPSWFGRSNPNPAVVSATPTFPLFERPPLPGSLGDTLNREYYSRELFRIITWRESVWTLFPTSLLWEPPLASKWEPRFSATGTSLDNYANENTLDTSIGSTIGLFRVEPVGSSLALQFDIFAVVHTRLSPDDLIANDYRFGVPISFQRGPWHGKLGYEHTSAHLGDEGLINGNLPLSRFVKDEIVFGLGRWHEDWLRIYGQVGYAFYQELPDTDDRFRFDAGFELYRRGPTGWQGTPFIAGNVDFRPESGYDPNLNVQAGWLWRNPQLRLAQFRVFAEYYTGRSVFGQLSNNRENYGGIGIAADY